MLEEAREFEAERARLLELGQDMQRGLATGELDQFAADAEELRERSRRLEQDAEDANLGMLKLRRGLASLLGVAYALLCFGGSQLLGGWLNSRAARH